jgi:phage-related minor tail protein
MASAYGKAGIPVVGGLFPGRAAGGPVSSGAPYMVGEHGPELFVPKTAGTIVPNGAGGVQVNVSGLILSDDPAARQQLATIIQDALVTAYRQHGNRQPV